MNNLDKQYLGLLQDIIDNGVTKSDRTGTGTISVFGRQIRHKMSDGFSILTTKKVAFKTMVVELLWFMTGNTNIKYLVDNGCNIWNGDCYQNFYKKSLEIKLAYESGDLLGSQPHIDAMFSNSNELIILSQEEFINKIKTDDEFAKEFGELGPIYGKQWRRWTRKTTRYEKIVNPAVYETHIDQIKNLINDLKTNPDSRRLMVSAWSVHEIQDMVLPPCHYGFQVYTRELSLEERRLLVSQEMFNQVYTAGGPETLSHSEINQWNIPTRAISLMYNARSQDVPLGTPFNLASYGLLLTIIAKEVNMIPDELISNMGDCHIYLNQIDGVKEQLTRESYPLPQLLGNDEYHYLMDQDMSFSDKIDQFKPDFWKLENYQSHPSIKIPLSN
jgi:thymidylate synthase